MKTTRRQFLKSLIATAATAAIAPQVLVESVHGASDLTARERDVAADVMGLRSKQWRGLDAFKRQLPFEHVNCRCVQVPMLLPGESLFRAIEFDVSDQEPLTEARVQKAFINLCEQQKIAERFPFATRHLRDLQNEYDNEPKIV